jgi:hypothetical protein
MPTVLRLVYSRFAVQEILSNKLESEVDNVEEQAPPPVDREYLRETPEMATDPQADQLIKRPAVDV